MDVWFHDGSGRLLACVWMGVTPAEMAEAQRWVAARFQQEPPFSFTYGGKSSADLLGGWKVNGRRASSTTPH